MDLKLNLDLDLDLDLDLELTDVVERVAAEHGTPGVSAGVLVDARALVALVGCTSTANPLPVDENTLFMIGSTSKTFTATALLALVERDALTLDDRVVQHVPDLRLADEQVAQSVTLRQLLNHTSGWAGDLLPPPGWGDDALARALDALAEAPQELPLGHAASYSNSAFLLAGHLLARVHGTTFEQAVRELVLEPLGLTGSWYLPWEMAHRRHAVGHVVRDGVPEPVETYPIGRATGPAGGLWSTLRDQLTYARFHLGGSTAGTPPLSEGSRLLMQQQTVATRSTMAGVGLSWLLHRHADVRLVAHGGNISNLQTSTFVLAPDHDLAVVVMTNAKHGQAIGDAVLEWALQRYRGVGPRPLLPPVTFEAEELVGEYDRGAFAWHLSAEDGRLFVDLKVPAGVPEEIRLAFTAPPRELVAVGPDVFALAGSPTGPVLDVRRAQDGTVEGIVHGMRFARRASRCPVVAPPFPM